VGRKRWAKFVVNLGGDPPREYPMSSRNARWRRVILKYDLWTGKEQEVPTEIMNKLRALYFQSYSGMEVDFRTKPKPKMMNDCRPNGRKNCVIDLLVGQDGWHRCRATVVN